jgi:Ni2+-binding GTPase involved in maturation of urease and hydrogenase
MTQRVRFLMVGGFLGAGKTTTLARLARHFTDAGLRVGLVTNDQAYDLVDTESLRSQGFSVGEVTGACFCCKFNDLVETASQLSTTEQPDIILAEPVGSCTDLVATVAKPMQHLYGEQYDVAPFAVLLKPEHGLKILADEGNLGFSAKAAYIFLKQLEEADLIVINKIDKLSADERDRLLRLVGERFPGKEVLAVSARQGDGFERLIAALERQQPARAASMEVDYDVYAEGEAELGWLNCTVALAAPTDGGSLPGAFALDDVVLELVRRLRTALAAESAEPAHLKVLGSADGDTAIANLVGSGVEVELSLASSVKVPSADLFVNARVALDPEDLTRVVEREAAAVAGEFGLRYEIRGMQSFRPGRPMPTHRMA